MLAHTANGLLREVQGLLHPESRLHARDIVSAPPGRQSGTGPRKHEVEGKTAPKETEARMFAQEIAERLRLARAEGAFEELALVAPPHFLGILRGRLDGPTRACVVSTIAKDLVQSDLGTIAAQCNAVH